VAALVSATRRALVLTVYSEGLLAVGALAFVLFPARPLLLVLGILGSLVFGAPAGLAFWAGRREFHMERPVARASAAFVVLFGSLILAYVQVTSVYPDSMRLRDLYAPWFFLGLALVADVAAILLLLWPLLPASRRWLHVTWVLGALATAVYAWHGQRVVADLVERSAGLAFVPAEAASYARDFTTRVVRDWALALLVVRIGFWPSLYGALSNVNRAEQEAAGRLGPDQPDILGGATR